MISKIIPIQRSHSYIIIICRKIVKMPPALNLAAFKQACTLIGQIDALIAKNNANIGLLLNFALLWDEPYNMGNYQGAYSATGAYGQFITVLPRLDLVVAFKTKYEYGRQTPTDLYLKVLDKLIAARKNNVN